MALRCGVLSLVSLCAVLTKSLIFVAEINTSTMAWRYKLGKNLQELRFLYCEKSVGSKGVR